MKNLITYLQQRRTIRRLLKERNHGLIDDLYFNSRTYGTSAAKASRQHGTLSRLGTKVGPKS